MLARLQPCLLATPAHVILRLPHGKRNWYRCKHRNQPYAYAALEYRRVPVALPELQAANGPRRGLTSRAPALG